MKAILVKEILAGPRRGLFAASVALFLAAAVLSGRGAWIYFKASLAQVLLRRAWARTVHGGKEVAPWPWADTWPIARLRVPALKRDAIVLAGVSGRTLAFGPGHLDGTARPGQPGNCVLSAHRDTQFDFLRSIAVGEALELETPDGRRHVYRVFERLAAHKSRADLLADTLEPTLTLVTCYPFDAVLPGGPLRFVVRARLISVVLPSGGLEKRSQDLEIVLSADEVRVVVRGAPDPMEFLRRGGQLEEPARVAGRHDVVFFRRDDQLWNRHSRYFRLVVETGAHEEARQQWIDRLRHRGDREKRGFQNHGAAGMPQRGLDRHGAAEGLSEEDDLVGPETASDRGGVDRRGIRVQALFARFAGARSVAPVIHEKDIDPERIDEQFRSLQAVADVASVAVEEEKGLPAISADPPARELDAVSGLERQRLRFQAEVLGDGGILPRREVDEAGLEAMEHQSEECGRDRDRKDAPLHRAVRSDGSRGDESSLTNSCQRFSGCSGVPPLASM